MAGTPGIGDKSEKADDAMGTLALKIRKVQWDAE